MNQKNFSYIFYGYTCINIEMFQNQNIIINTTSINQTGTKSNKITGKTNSSTRNDVMNKIQSNIKNELSNKKNNKKNKNDEKSISNMKNQNKEKIDILHQLNYFSFSGGEKELKIKLKDEHKIRDENTNLSLQKFLNCSNQKRIKFSGLNKNILIQNNNKDYHSNNKKKEKMSNLSDLDPSILYNFKKIGTILEEKNDIIT